MPNYSQIFGSMVCSDAGMVFIERYIQTIMKTIDMVITKSVSRFARNTVTSLETVRELKLLGVDVYF